MGYYNDGLPLNCSCAKYTADTMQPDLTDLINRIEQLESELTYIYSRLDRLEAR